MMYSHGCTRCAQLVSATVVTTALTLGYSAVPPQSAGTALIANGSVQVEVALASAVISSSGGGEANAATNLPGAIADTVTAIANAAAWYLGSVLSIPYSLFMGMMASGLNFSNPNRLTPLDILSNALFVYTYPLIQVRDAISQLFNPTASATDAIAVPVAAESPATAASANPSGGEAVESKVPFVSATASTAALPSPSGAATAAATTFGPLGDFVYDLARNVALAVGLALVPLWWLGAPITFPIGWSIGQALFPNDNWGLFPGMARFSAAVFAPFSLLTVLLPDRLLMRSSSAAAVRPASARSRLTGKPAVSPAPVKRAAAAVRSSGTAKAAGAVSKRSPARTVSR